MLATIIGFIFGCAYIGFVEYLYRKKRINAELSRKMIHVAHGLIIVALSFHINYSAIILLEMATLVLVILARRYRWFGNQYYMVERQSWGELFFPAGIIFIAFLEPTHWLFVVSILHLALADSAAALVGIKYGRRTSYNVFGQKKSVAGSAAFFAVSVLIMLVALPTLPVGMDIAASFFLVPLVATIAENVGVYGVDNFLIPLAVMLLLR
ncbi:MAG TPA: hypothetical protein PKA02_02720 [Candidatus Saccharibacteria bacterium]|nr:hypothetical protein [Candidatus Saccharibacteria bacterium]